jgi:hypothetical protein
MIAEGVLDVSGERVCAADGPHARARGASSGIIQGRSGPITGGPTR